MWIFIVIWRKNNEIVFFGFWIIDYMWEMVEWFMKYDREMNNIKY